MDKTIGTRENSVDTSPPCAAVMENSRCIISMTGATLNMASGGAIDAKRTNISIIHGLAAFFSEDIFIPP